LADLLRLGGHDFKKIVGEEKAVGYRLEGVSLIYLESLASELRRIGAEADGRAGNAQGAIQEKIKPGFLAGVLSTLFSAQSRRGET